ncbi:MAG: EVE domain-containing protein [Bdellovibrionota bacterium]
MKSEPDVYSIDKLKKEHECLWEGVRNYQARNFMQEMKMGDEVLFYHSNAEPSGIAGVAKVSHEALPDPTQFKKASEYFDPTAKKDAPRWHCVKVQFGEKFPRILTLNEMKEIPHIQDMLVLRKGQRLSVMPVDKVHFEYIVELMRRTNG